MWRLDGGKSGCSCKAGLASEARRGIYREATIRDLRLSCREVEGWRISRLRGLSDVVTKERKREGGEFCSGEAEGRRRQQKLQQ
jgi:hypothetical protein